MYTNKQTKRILSLVLALVMVMTFVVTPVTAKAADAEDFIRVFHLDAGRKYFTVAQVEEIIDTLSASGYTHLELVVGNEGLRLLLDDMSVTVGSTTYSSANVSAGIKQGNVNHSHAGEWTQAEMDGLIAYAEARHIGIIPLVNTPGHMNAILDAAEYVGISSPAYSTKVSNGWWGSTTKSSGSTVALDNASAVGFTQALVQKYVDYFAASGCEYFNMGADEYANDVHTSGAMGFGALQSSGTYGNFVTYINDVATMIKEAGMKPVAFNDGIYFNQKTTGTFDPDIIIAYWTSGWGTYAVAPASYLVNKGHKILNTNDAWYYVLGRNGQNDGYGYTSASKGVSGTAVTSVPGTGTMSTDSLAGSMSCLWCDDPSADYNSNKTKVMYLIETLAASNPDYFVVYTGPEHVYETVTVEPTCTEDGSVTTFCTLCGESTVEVLPALGHAYDSVVTAPTCTEDGCTTHTCRTCGDCYVTDVVTAPGHAYETLVTAPTCTEDGFTTHTCANCGDSYVSDETAALGHAYEALVTAPTCTEDGFTTHTCTNCGDSYISNETAALGHAWKSVVTAPTCTEDGFTTHTCTLCGSIAVDSRVEALGHSCETVTVEPTCTEDGFVSRSCTVCGDSSTELLPAPGHAYETVTIAATCETAGSVSSTCAVCGHHVEEALPALGHAYASVVTAPTCTEGGFTTHTCGNCGDSYVSDETAAQGHAYETLVTAPTCTEGGFTANTCANCGDTYISDETATLGHAWESVVTVPTCTEGGFTTNTCAACGDSYISDETAALGHAYESLVTAPTCTEGGFTTNTCAACGDSYVSDETDALGHSYSTVETPDALIHTCDHCGDSYSESIGWIALSGTYVLDTDGIDVGAEHKYLVVGDSQNYALTRSGNSIGAAKVTVDGNAIRLADASAYEFYFMKNNAESGSYLLTQDGRSGVYHMGGNLYYGTDNKGYWHFGSSSNGSYQLYDTDNQKWYLNYGYVWANEAASRFAVSSNARSLRLFQAVDSYVRLTGALNQTWAHGAQVTEAAVLEQVMLQTSTDGASVSTSAPLTAAMVTWDKAFDGYTAGTYTATVSHSGQQIGTVTVTVTGEHDYETVCVEPTCTAQGYSTHTCTICGLSHTDSRTDALGHSYTSRETEDAIVYTCTRCGDSYSESLAPDYVQVTAFTTGGQHVVTLYSGSKYYALSHANNQLSAVQVTVSNGKITSEITEDLLWTYSGSKLSYKSGSTTRYLYASSPSWWGSLWGSSPTLGISTSSSSSVSFSSSRVKVGSYYLRFSGSSISLSSSATTAYLFLETEK